MELKCFSKKVFNLILLLFLCSCSTDISKISDNYSSEQILDLAQKSIEEKDFEKAGDIYMKLSELYPYSDDARKSLINAVKSYEKADKNEEMRFAIKKFTALYPINKNSEFLEFSLGKSYYNQIIDIERDQGSAFDAIKQFEKFLSRYPSSIYADEIKKKKISVNNQLSGQEMSVGRYYLNKKKYLASIKRFQGVVTNYPETRHYPEALFRLVEVYAILGIKDSVKNIVNKISKEHKGSIWEKKALDIYASNFIEG